MDDSNAKNEVVINEKSMEILVAKFIPTSQYFERSFEMLQEQLRDNKEEQKTLRKDMDKKFEQVEKRFEQVDKRFEQVEQTIIEFKKDVNERFEQVDKRFEQVDKRFEKIDERFDKVDERFEKMSNSITDISFKIEQLTRAQETTIRDYIIERDRHYDAKFNNLRMFNIATISLVAGVILKMAGIINI